MTKNPKPVKPSKNYTLSIRLTAEEHERLDKAAVGTSYSAYARRCILGEDAAPCRTRGKHPVKDHSILSRILAKLGASRMANNLNQIAHAANCGALALNPELRALLMQACADVREIKTMLMKALGLGL